MTEMTHSRLGASSCSRWLACPGSVQLINTLPEENRNSIYAAEGTCAHELCEHMLRFGIPQVPVEDDGQLGEKVEVDDFEITINKEMIEATRLYAKTILDDMVNAGLTLEGSTRKHPIDPLLLNVEQKFVISSIDQELSGTNDASVWNPEEQKLTIYDFKYGKGVPVEAEENVQLAFYALGVIDVKKIDPAKVELVIIQPRCPHPDGPIRRWEVPSDWAKWFRRALEQGVAATRSANPKFEGGSHCRWCRAKSICPLYRQNVNEAVQMDFAPVPAGQETNRFEPPKVEDLDIPQISRILKLAPMVEDFIKDVQEKATELLNQGLEVPGFKLVQKRANRKWLDEDQVAEAFGDVAVERKVKSPAQLEKLVGKDAIQDYIITPEAGTTLVPESDKRQAVVPVQQSFDCIGFDMDI